MKNIFIALGLILFLSYPFLRAQSSNAPEPADEQDTIQMESVDADVVVPPIMYTMTAGSFETGGRVLLSAVSGSNEAAVLGEDQAEKSGLEAAPSAYALEQNFPNPFNPTTTIRFTLQEQAQVTLKVYNMLGQEVAAVLNGMQLDQGEHDVEFNAGNLASGAYFYHLEARGDDATNGTFIQVKRMMIVK